MQQVPRAVLAIVVVWTAVLPAQEPPATPERALLSTGEVWLQRGTERWRVPYARTSIGPLFAIQPIVGALGGELVVGPLGQSHYLRLDDQIVRFGPESREIVVDQQIALLSQLPRRSLDVTLVPLDLLELTYGEWLGLEIQWRSEEQTLLLAPRPRRLVPVGVDLVHLRGLSTLVLQFSTPPRYEIVEEAGLVQVVVRGDELVPPPRPMPIDDPLVSSVSIQPGGVEIRLVPGAASRSYTLVDPFRIVFDVYRGGRSGTNPLPGQSPDGDEGLWTIVVDPGHGGSETGATGPTGAEEKLLTLTIARLLKRQLESRLPVRVVLTRDEDVSLPLDTRTAIANQNKADLFISIHLNSSRGSGASGAETYFLSLEASDPTAAAAAELENASPGGTGDPTFDLQLILWDLAQSIHLAESQRFAKLVQEELNHALGLRDRGVRQAPFRVLMGAAMPAVLVELGFLSNPAEETKLSDPEHRLALVDSLVRAVMRFRARREAGEAGSTP